MDIVYKIMFVTQPWTAVDARVFFVESFLVEVLVRRCPNCIFIYSYLKLHFGGRNIQIIERIRWTTAHFRTFCTQISATMIDLIERVRYSQKKYLEGLRVKGGHSVSTLTVASLLRGRVLVVASPDANPRPIRLRKRQIVAPT